MKPQDVQYLTDAPARWKGELDAATGSFEALETMLYEWRELCPDAFEARPKGAAEFREFVDGLKMERGGRGKPKRFAGEKWADRFGAILIPAKLMRVSMVAERYKVPWGTAYIRLADAASETA